MIETGAATGGGSAATGAAAAAVSSATAAMASSAVAAPPPNNSSGGPPASVEESIKLDALVTNLTPTPSPSLQPALPPPPPPPPVEGVSHTSSGCSDENNGGSANGAAATALNVSSTGSSVGSGALAGGSPRTIGTNSYGGSNPGSEKVGTAATNGGGGTTPAMAAAAAAAAAGGSITSSKGSSATGKPPAGARRTAAAATGSSPKAGLSSSSSPRQSSAAASSHAMISDGGLPPTAPPPCHAAGQGGGAALPRNPRDTIASGSPKRRIQSHKSLPGNAIGGGSAGAAGAEQHGGGGGSSIPPGAHPPRVVQRQSPASHASGLSGAENSGKGGSNASYSGAGGDGGISPARAANTAGAAAAGAQQHPQQAQSSSSVGKQRAAAISSSVSASGVTGMRVVSGVQNLGIAGTDPLLSSASASAQPLQPTSQIILRSDPDAEEQAMFEQRLCEDEFGVAVRKINSNGKSQLRYVRCVPLVPVPAEGGEGESRPSRGRGRARMSASKSGTSSVMSSTNQSNHQPSRQRALSSSRSVSSLMGRIGRSRRDRSQSRDPSLRKGAAGHGHGHGHGPHKGGKGGKSRDRSVDRHSSATDDGSYADASHAEQQAAHLLGGGSANLSKQDRALAWGNKKKVRIPLNRFVAVRKGKTTDRTRRNICPSSRLLSLITDGGHSQQCLDIEAPTKLDRDKFARAFAKFLDVPLVTEGEGEQQNGGSRRGVKDGAATVGEERPGTKNYQITKKSQSKKKLLSSGASAPDLSTSPTSAQSMGASSPTSTTTTPSQVGSSGPANPAALLPAIQRDPSGDDDIRFTFSGNRMDSSAASGAGSRQGSSVGLGGYLATGGQAGATGRPPRGISAGSGVVGGALSASGAGHSMSSSNAGVVHSMGGGSSNALLSDAALRRIENEEEEEDGALLLHTAIASPARNTAEPNKELSVNTFAASASARASSAPTNQTISPSIKINHHHHSHHQTHGGGAVDGPDGGGDDAGTEVSSLTQGFDQEIVEELHQALTELRAELEASRAEAARAVKVAEQAIQSAESCSSNDWNSTVTHKAAEAAAQAQKRSAEAMARQRLAEEKLASERKSAQFWRKQAEVAEEEAGLLTTRAAAAEVQRSAIATELESEQRKHAAYTAAIRVDHETSDRARREALSSAAERNRIVEMELDGTRKDLAARSEEAKVLHETLSEVSKSTHKGKKMPFRGRKRETTTVTSNGIEIVAAPGETTGARHLLKLHSEARSMRHELELLRRTTADEIGGLPYFANEWVGKAAAALSASQTEARVLRDKLALESSMRRKLLHEVQDLRGNIRVYCRPRSLATDNNAILSVPSHNVVLLHRDRILSEDSFDNPTSMAPMSFEFDRVFSPDCQQKEVYSEVEELVLGALDGYNVCLMAYGQRGTGKTHTLMGDYEVTLGDEPTTSIDLEGIHMMAAQQLFTIAEHRSERYQDCFTMTIVEVHNEKLHDMLAGTLIAEERGQVQVSPQAKSRSSRNRNARGVEGEVNINSNASLHGSSAGSKALQRLEIRTNYDGDTIVQGQISVDVKSFDDVCRIWNECLIERSARLAERGIDESEYTAESHVIATLSVVSTNITTGIGTTGKIQFADLAASDLESTQRNAPKSSNPTPIEGVLSGVGNSAEWKYKNRSLTTLLDVVNARSQFSRSVPYRNSTVTHLLRDSITSDTKFLLLTTVSTDARDVQNTASALRFASQMRRINIGKATKHTVSLA